jgi:curved DNA-binding protein CbpA
LTFETTPLSAQPGSPPIAADDETHYQLLGLPYTASQAEITRAYRAAMKRVHPDRARPERRAAAEEYAKRLNLAYATLSKPSARRAYDETIKARSVQDQIMNRYVGGFAGPGMEMGGAFGQELRREMTRAERREQTLAGRSATASVLLAFVSLAGLIVAILLVVSLIDWALGAIF